MSKQHQILTDQQEPILTNIPYSLNIYWLILVSISKGTFCYHEKS